METEPISEITERALKSLREIPEQEWPEVYDLLNSWNWSSKLGIAPTDWNTMPSWSNRKFLGLTIYQEDRRTRTKNKIITPIMRCIELKIGRKAILRHHHVHNLGRTEQQFEDWWDSQSFFSRME